MLETARNKIKYDLSFSLLTEHRAGNPLLLKEEIQVYGLPPGNSVVSIAQETGISVRYSDGGRRGRLNLRNFGYWGSKAGYSIGIPFSTQDPLIVDEAYLEFELLHDEEDITGETPAATSIQMTFGRSYFRFGRYGFITDFLYRPTNSAGVFYRTGIFSINTKAVSRYDIPDYYAAEISLNPGLLTARVFGFISDLSSEKMDILKRDNDRGAGANLSFKVKNTGVFFEDVAYRPSPSSDFKNAYLLSLDLFRTKSFGLNFKYCRYPEMPRETKPLNRAGFDYTGEQFLRFEADSLGYGLYLTKRLGRAFILDFEWSLGQRETEEEIEGEKKKGEEIFHRGIVRLTFIQKNRLKLALESILDTDRNFGTKNYTTRALFNFSF